MAEKPSAVVTGAASGIGRALAQNLHRRGFRLALCDVNEAGLTETAGGLDAPLNAMVDVAKRDQVEAFAERALAHFGGATDLVINNAGVDVSDSLATVSYEDFEWLFNINFWGVVYGTRAFLPSMLQAKRGTVINISSLFGLVGWPSHGTYCAAKFAVRGYTETLRHELRGTGVTAICVHPGGIKTNILRNARFVSDPSIGATAEAAVARFDQIAKTTPEQAAEQIVGGYEKGTQRILIGSDARAVDRLQRWLPTNYFSVVAAVAHRLGGIAL